MLRGVLCAALVALPALVSAQTRTLTTYHEHVVPVLQKHCQTCHRPGEAAPFSMLTYKDTRPWASAMKRAAVSRIDQIQLAGAFGSYIDPRYAMLLGLIPDAPLECVSAVGNAAGDGARIALLNRDKRAEAAAIARRVTYIETAADPDFQTEFVSAIHIPHATDPFTHLESELKVTLHGQPEADEALRTVRRRERVRSRQSDAQLARSRE